MRPANNTMIFIEIFEITVPHDGASISAPLVRLFVNQYCKGA
jgi:hypothetical protein